MARGGIDNSTFKQIFRDHWDDFKAIYPRFDTDRYNSTVISSLRLSDRLKFVLFE